MQHDFDKYKQDIKILIKWNVLSHMLIHIFFSYHVRKPGIK